MIHVEKNGLKWLEFELLADFPEITHAVFTRHGGCSQEHLASLNLGNSRGDKPEYVEKNRAKVTKALSLSQLFVGRQCHGINIFEVTSSSINESLVECDGHTTQADDIGLMILQADCQAAIFYDPIHRVVGNVHCGWRGNVQNIYAQMIQHMKCIYQSRPENLIVCISPSLGPESSEFIHYKTELPESFWGFQIRPHYFDLWAVSEWQLTQAGVLPHHMQIARIDTFANDDDFFSHRRDKCTGRQATVCALKQAS